MNRVHMQPLLTACFAALVLTACGGQSADSGTSAKSADATSIDQAAQSEASSATSDLDAFGGEDICSILDQNALTTLFSPKAEVETRSRVNKRGASCTWSWPRPDAEERRQALVKAMMARMKSGAKTRPDDKTAYSLNYTVRVELQDTHATARNFVPRKLSEGELQAQIARMKKRTQERLTDRQKLAMAQTGMGGMAGRLLRKANQREVINAVGDAAYWVPVGNGTLHVLNGDKVVLISSSLADDKQGRIDAARKIYASIAR